MAPHELGAILLSTSFLAALIVGGIAGWLGGMLIGAGFQDAWTGSVRGGRGGRRARVIIRNKDPIVVREGILGGTFGVA